MNGNIFEEGKNFARRHSERKTSLQETFSSWGNNNEGRNTHSEGKKILLRGKHSEGNIEGNRGMTNSEEKRSDWKRAERKFDWYKNISSKRFWKIVLNVSVD